MVFPKVSLVISAKIDHNSNNHIVQAFPDKTIIHYAGHFYHIGGGNRMTAADFAALYGTGTEDMTEPSMRDNFFYTEEDDDDEGAEWD